jgi:kynurenine formamidase
MRRALTGLFLALCPVLPASPDPLDLSNVTMVDLSHSYGDDTLYWPTSPTRFSHETLAHGETPGGYFYSAYSLCTPEHGGTHLDAPIHFHKDRQTTEQVPLENLILPVVIIDVQAKAKADPVYRMSVADVAAFEAEHGPVPAGSAVLLRTGWDRYWPDAKSYLGDDTPGDASHLRFPSFGAEAVKLLVEERQVRLLGIDTASIDYGPSDSFPVHRLLGDADIPALENLANLTDLPQTGATLIALPMKIKGGSGGPARVVALVPR